MPKKNAPKAPIAIPAPDEVDTSSSNTSTADRVVLHLTDQDVSVTVPAPVALLQEEEPSQPEPTQEDTQQEATPEESQPVSSEAEGGAAGGKAAPKKRKRGTKPTVLDEHIERELGDWLEFEVAFIYDKKDHRHTNKDLVNATWATKA